MQASHHATAGEGLGAFADWSTSDPEYADHRERIRVRWESLRDDAPNPVTSAFLHRVLGEAGGGVPHADASDDFETVADSSAQPCARQRFTALRRSEWDAAEPTRWLVKGFLPEDALVAIYGPPASCKSFVAVDLAASVATGKDWHGRKVARGGVVYVAAEGPRGVKERVTAWELDRGTGPAEGVTLVGQPVRLGDAAEGRAFAEWLAAELGPQRLVVVDTLARCMGGKDENSAADMGAFIQGCDAIRLATGATVVVVHHSGKDAGKGLRGSTALLGALDTCVYVRRSTDGQSIELTVDKQKDADEGAPIHLAVRRVQLPPGTDGEPRSSLVLRDPQPAAEAEADFLDAVPRAADGSLEMLPLLAARARSSGGRVPLKEVIPLVMGVHGGSASSARRRIEKDVPMGRRRAADAYGTKVWLERQGTHSTAPLVVCVEGGTS